MDEEIILEVRKKPDLPVGKHNDIDDSKFDSKQLKMGIAVELEHTNNREIAKAIAKDHLAEIPFYYTLLEIMEETYTNSVKKSKGKAQQIYKDTVSSLQKKDEKEKEK